jgi:tRNA pseudouridine32 synthase/23S rRNA pseudouridine746 synthase
MIPPEPILDIIHEDPDFVVVNKVSGMLSVPGRGPEKVELVLISSPYFFIF